MHTPRCHVAYEKKELKTNAPYISGYPRMKVAAYQTPLDATYSLDVLNLVRKQIAWCESNDVEILCCPEAVLGGLADYSSEPTRFAIKVDKLDEILQPISSETVTTIIGFTEIDCAGRLYNSAAVFHRGVVVGLYRKIHPFINKSVYYAGQETPVFEIGGLMFGIIICLDSNYVEPAKTMVAKGATALFIPSNNGMPEEKGGAELVNEARKADTRLAMDNGIYVIRADVAGRADGLVSYGSSGVIDQNGRVLRTAKRLLPERFLLGGRLHVHDRRFPLHRSRFLDGSDSEGPVDWRREAR